MKNLLLLFIPVCLVFPLHAQINAEDSTVQTVAYWQKRDTMVYRLTKVKITETDNVPDTIQKSVYRLTMTIDDSTETSYTVRWQYYLLDMTANGRKMIIAEPFRKFTDYTLVVKTDELGVFDEWLNWRDVKEQMDKLLTLQQLSKKDTTSDKVKEAVQGLMDDPELYFIAFKELKLYFTFYGYQFVVHQPLIDTLEVDYIMGDGTVKMESTTWIDSIDLSSDSYVLFSHQTLDKTQFKNMMDDMVENIAPEKASEPFVTEEFLRDFTFDDAYGAVFHGPTGWLVRMEFIREASITPVSVTYEEIYIEIE
ncbi:MAG: hypothetical protein IT270_19115 [Saprospiraceae bacterium]|nr:hypothetical protein [Saprospiraceae bacterium]